MKTTLSILGLGLLLFACQPPADNSAKEAFAKNSETVKAYLADWQAENVDYGKYFSQDFISRGTGVGSPDTMDLEMEMKGDKGMWEWADFELVSELQLLPGVNPESKEMDGSVRFYGEWKLTVAATDSTPEASVMVKTYHSYDFDEEGKMLFGQTYGDWGGVGEALEDQLEGEEEEDDDDGDDA